MRTRAVPFCVAVEVQFCPSHRELLAAEVFRIGASDPVEDDLADALNDAVWCADCNVAESRVFSVDAATVERAVAP